MSSSSNNPNLLTTPKGKVLFAKLVESVAELEGENCRRARKPTRFYRTGPMETCARSWHDEPTTAFEEDIVAKRKPSVTATVTLKLRDGAVSILKIDTTEESPIDIDVEILSVEKSGSVIRQSCSGGGFPAISVGLVGTPAAEAAQGNAVVTPPTDDMSDITFEQQGNSTTMPP